MVQFLCLWCARSVSSIIIYTWKNFSTLIESSAVQVTVTPVQKMLYQHKLHIEILDYDWLKDNRNFSKPISSRKKSFLEWEEMAALNQEWFAMPTDDAIEELRNGAKNIKTSKSVWKTWCEGRSITLEIAKHESAELNRLLEKFNAEVKNRSSGTSSSPIFSSLYY